MTDSATERFDRYARLTDGPLLVLAVLMVPLLAAPFLWELSGTTAAVIRALDYLIWAMFALDYMVRLYIAPRRLHFFRTHLIDLVIVLVPFLRPVRALRAARVIRLLRLGRLGAFAVRTLRDARSVFSRRGLNYTLLVVLSLVLVAALAVREFERGFTGANIRSLPDALWWAATTVTTVGYGDRFPLSPAGRGVAVVLMIAGIAVFGVLTASIAAYFVEQDTADKNEEHLLEIVRRLEALEAAVKELGRYETR